MTDEQERLLFANTQLLVRIGTCLSSSPEMLAAIVEGTNAIKWAQRSWPDAAIPAKDPAAEAKHVAEAAAGAHFVGRLRGLCDDIETGELNCTGVNVTQSMGRLDLTISMAPSPSMRRR